MIQSGVARRRCSSSAMLHLVKSQSVSQRRERAREMGGKVIEPFSQTVGADLADLLYIRKGTAGKYCVHGYRDDNILREMSSYKHLHRLPSVMILDDKKTELSKHRRRMKLCQHLYLKVIYTEHF